MKLVVKSEAGTIFVLDSKNMTWVRTPAHGPDSIFPVNEGKLAFWPNIAVGQRLTIRSLENSNLTITSAPIKIVFEVGSHDEEMYGVRIPKSKAEKQAYIDNYSKSAAVGKDSSPKIGKWVSAKFGAVTGRTSSKHENLSNTPKPMTQADGFADSDPLEFAILPGGGKLRYTDETRTTFRYVPKDEPRKATVCTRDEGHTGPCNGFPRIGLSSMCYNGKKEETKDERRKELLSALEKATGLVIEQARYICEASVPTVSDVSELRRLGKTYEKFKRDLSNLN